MEDKNIDLGAVSAQSAGDGFWALRGHAIQQYANIERSLCMLFAELASLKHDVAGLIFFRITNPRSVGAILQDLLNKRHGDAYSKFWNSFAKLVQRAIETRNHVVHWNVATFIDGGYAGTKLVPADVFNYGTGSPTPIGSAELVDFIRKCDFISRLCNMFSLHLDAGHPGVPHAPWPDIFQQPVVYPPPDTHPLSPKWKAPETPPPPSPE